MLPGRRSLRGAWSDFFRGLAPPGELPRLLALMGLFFLVVCAVGILRPIKNSLALDGLGATDFARVYLVSALVLLFAPVFTHLSDRVPWHRLFAGIALFFAANLLLFRALYREGSGTFGLVFYGWYDLFAAALVAQFFMATQCYFDARSARRAYPAVIAGGSIGATLGGAITGFFAESVGTPNLLLVAAALIGLFAAAIPWVLHGSGVARPLVRPGAASPGRGRIRELLADRQVRLIAGTVLLTIIVKQLVDYQFNIITQDIFETRDAISSFQGKFNAATQWLPLVVLAGLRPAMRRWGIGTAVLLLPVLMLGTTIAVGLTFSLWAAVAAKGAETSLRYSAERAGREILYIPVRDEIKLKAKAWIDVGVEKGLGKVVSGLFIMTLLTVMDYRRIAWVAAALALVWLFMAVAVRYEYVRTLARSMEGRFASVRGIFATLGDASTLPVIRDALLHASPLRAAFALELVAQFTAEELRGVAGELNRLVAHDRAEIRHAALVQLARIPDAADLTTVRARLVEDTDEVREAAVRVLLAASAEAAPALLNELLRSDDAAVRSAALTCISAVDAAPALREAGRRYATACWNGAPPDDGHRRAELAVAAAAFDNGDTPPYLVAFLEDHDPNVARLALRSAAILGRTDCCDLMIRSLADPATRQAARDALARLGVTAVAPLTDVLLDEQAPARLRRVIPATLARIPSQQTVDSLLHLVLAPETDQLLDYRTLKALSKLRATYPDLVFDRDLVHRVAERESDVAVRYADVLAGLPVHTGDRVTQLLRTALEEAIAERREGVMRCLGMLHSPEPVRRAARGLESADRARRARAIEWIEETIGAEQFRRLAPVIEPVRRAAVPVPVAALLNDGDAWIAHLAAATVTPGEHDMELIEKVFLLQQVDLLRGARGAHVALLASIAEEIDVPAGTVLLDEGDVPAALYVVTAGAVELSGVGQRLVVGPEHAFGTWSLIDDRPSPIHAQACEQTRLLRVTRDDFRDLLADHSELALGLLEGLAQRVRSLVA